MRIHNFDITYRADSVQERTDGTFESRFIYRNYLRKY